MEDILQHIYCERIVKGINKRKEDLEQYLECAARVDLHDLAAKTYEKMLKTSPEKPDSRDG